jgi:hypothetical protein
MKTYNYLSDGENKILNTTRGIKHWGIVGYINLLPRIKFGVTG